MKALSKIGGGLESFRASKISGCDAKKGRRKTLADLLKVEESAHVDEMADVDELRGSDVKHHGSPARGIKLIQQRRAVEAERSCRFAFLEPRASRKRLALRTAVC